MNETKTDIAYVNGKLDHFESFYVNALMNFVLLLLIGITTG